MAQVAIEQLGRRQAFGSTAPTAGTWVVGDEVKNTAPSSAGIEKWVCVTAGTPGTWEAVYVPGVVLSPAQITANTDDYNPTSLATAYVLRLSTDASRDLTGIVGGASRRELVLANVGSFNIVFKHNVTSTAANRFFCPGSVDFTLGSNATVQVQYDSTSSRWRVIGQTAATGTGVATDTIWDAKGNLAAGTGPDTAAKLIAGSNDTILMADSAETTGLKWVAAATPSTQASGDAPAEGTDDTFTRGGHKHGMPDIYIPVTFAYKGTIATGTGVLRWYNDSGRTLTIAKIRASAGTAPTGAAILDDVNVDGTTIWSTQGNRVTIAAGANTGSTTTFNTTTIADGSYLTVDIDQVGSTVVGADHVATIWLKG